MTGIESKRAISSEMSLSSFYFQKLGFGFIKFSPFKARMIKVITRETLKIICENTSLADVFANFSNFHETSRDLGALIA